MSNLLSQEITSGNSKCHSNVFWNPKCHSNVSGNPKCHSNVSWNPKCHSNVSGNPKCHSHVSGNPKCHSNVSGNPKCHSNVSGNPKCHSNASLSLIFFTAIFSKFSQVVFSALHCCYGGFSLTNVPHWMHHLKVKLLAKLTLQWINNSMCYSPNMPDMPFS